LFLFSRWFVRCNNFKMNFFTSTEWADKTNDIHSDKSFVLSVHFVAIINIVFLLLERPIRQRITFEKMGNFCSSRHFVLSCSWTSFFCSCHIDLFFSLDDCNV
jgi:hypothetical protein